MYLNLHNHWPNVLNNSIKIFKLFWSPGQKGEEEKEICYTNVHPQLIHLHS